MLLRDGLGPAHREGPLPPRAQRLDQLLHAHGADGARRRLTLHHRRPVGVDPVSGGEPLTIVSMVATSLR
jgi:hypothetical protein